ncbi:unnamed protein product, partial [Rotaria sp. Silwood2]
MATNRPSSSNTTTTISSAIIIHELAELLRTNGHRVLHGDSKVCFTSDSLTLLNNYFHSAKLNMTLPLSNGHPRTNSLPSLPPLPAVQYLRITTKLRDDLVFLHDFLQKIQVVKLIHNSPTLQGNVLLYPFQHVVCLELKKIPPHMVLGLSLLRQQLETLICSQSVTKIEDLISDCGGDSTQPQAWPRLKSLFLAHNFIECLDQSLKYLVTLEVLDLSHNRLQDCSKILDIIPHVKHLNLSSNHLRSIPIWSETKGSCRLLTLKIRQNSIEDITGIELMKSIEELDLSDNFITRIPELIRQMSMIKRLFFARNPFTYASNYRQNIINNLPFVFSQEARELIIDNEQLTSKEKQKIPRKRIPPSNLVQGFRFSSPPSSSQNTTTSESTTEPESIVTNSSGTIVSRRRSRRKFRDGRLRSLDTDETPTEHATSGSENESAVNRHRLGKVVESRHEVDHNYLTSQSPITAGNIYTTTTLEQDDTILKSLPSTTFASSIPRKLANELSYSPKRKKSPRSRKSDQPTKIVLEVVDFQNTMSDATPVPESPTSEKEISFNDKYSTIIMPKHEIQFITNEEHTTGDSIRTIFFVTDQTSDDRNNRSLTIEIDRMYL